MTEIVVSGAAQVRLPADRAVVDVSVAVNGPQRDEVMRQAAAEHARLVARAVQLVEAGSAASYSASPVDTYTSSWRDERGAQITEHHASVALAIELSEPGLVAELTFELAQSGADARVSWELSDAQRRDAARALRAEALADARRAADDYAAALGDGVGGRLLSLRDGQGGYGGPIPVMRAAMMADKAAPEVTAREVEVSVQLEATFATL